MSNQKDGGPAFPRTGYYPPEAQGMEAWRKRSHTETDPTKGMTLRDYFAAKAMQGFIANPEFGSEKAKYLADCSFMQADAMLEARNQ